MCGGTYLCYEGAEKVWERLRGHEDHSPVGTEDGELGAEHEASMVGGAIRTDFILFRRDHGDRAQRGRRRVVRGRRAITRPSSLSASPLSSTAWSRRS